MHIIFYSVWSVLFVFAASKTTYYWKIFSIKQIYIYIYIKRGLQLLVAND